MYELFHSTNAPAVAPTADRRGRARAIIGIAGAAICAAICLLGATVTAAARPAPEQTRERGAERASPDTPRTDARWRAAMRSACGIVESGLSGRMAEARCIREARRLPTRPGSPAS